MLLSALPNEESGNYFFFAILLMKRIKSSPNLVEVCKILCLFPNKMKKNLCRLDIDEICTQDTKFSK